MRGFWELNVIEGKNPIHTGQFLNSYDQREFTPEEVVARESAQNSMDAGEDIKGITELEFHALEIAGEKKSRLLQMFGFEGLLAKRIKAFKKNKRNQNFASDAQNFLKSKKTTALLIRDKKTCGLGGAWNRYGPNDHFARLVCALNFDDKADDNSNSGGSFGLGKTAYAENSAINTVLYHSTFKPVSGIEGGGVECNRRLMVAGVYPRHELDGTEYGGFAYFGKQIPGTKEAALFENEEAQKIWREVTSLFGINAERADDEYGTDVLIFMSSVDLDKIKVAIEDYYFPAIIDGKINVKFYDVKGHKSFPTPHTRKDLEQFIRLVKEAKRDTKEKTESKEVANLNKVKGCKIGRIAFEAVELDGVGLPRNNCVAVMRGTGMIINYLKHGLEQYEPIVGAFVADKDIWKYLVASENAAHSQWNDKSTRLKRDFPENGQEIVKRLNGNVRTRFLNFQKGLQPDVSVTRNESGLLARLLSGALSGSPGSEPIPEGDPNPVSLSLIQCQREKDISKWRLQIQSNNQTPDGEFILKLSPYISVAGDLRKVSVKNMGFKVTNEAGKVFSTSELESMKFQKGSTVDLFITFDNPKKWNCIVKCKCEALIGTEQ